MFRGDGRFSDLISGGRRFSDTCLGGGRFSDRRFVALALALASKAPSMTVLMHSM